MFGKKKKESSQPIEMGNSNTVKKTSSGNGSACVIVKGTVIEGTFKSTNDTRMDGIIKGDFHCDARMIMGQEAVIEGNVYTKEASISGTFSGEMKVQHLLALSSTAKVQGIISANELSVDDGANLNGTVNIGGEK